MRVHLTTLALLFSATLAQTVTYEAEDAQLTGVTVGTSVAGFSGRGYVESFDEANDKITFTVNAQSQGLYDLTIVYAAPYGQKVTTVVLNSAAGSQVTLTPSDAFTSAPAGQVLLNAGANTVEIQNNWGWYLIDAIKLSPAQRRGPHQVTGGLVNSNSNQVTRNLMSWLVSKYGKAFISGQQDQASLEWVEKNIGKTPAILGLDLMDYTQSRIDRGASGNDVNHALAFDKRGGIVTFVWHWGAPVGLYDTSENPWWSGFYTRATDFDISKAVEPTNANHTLLLKDIDQIAVQLKKLQDAGVPVLWRPLHEAEGGWFWWGAKGAEPCKKLWRLLYSRLTSHHQINNLIWVWNSVSSDWYPGDDTVDIVSYDSYPSAGDHGPVSAQYNSLLSLGKDKKLIALTECSSIPDPDQLQLYQADWSYWVTWGGEFINDGNYNSLSFLRRLYAHSYVLTLDEISGWKNGVDSPSSTTSSPTTTPSTLSTITTPQVTTTSAGLPTTTSVVTVPRWGQCGGINYRGPNQCASGTTCTELNPYYSQCL